MRYTVAELRFRRLRIPVLVVGAVAATVAAGFIIVEGIDGDGRPFGAETPAHADSLSSLDAESTPQQPAAAQHEEAAAGPDDVPPSGDLPNGTSVFATGFHGIEGLDPGLLATLRQASSDSGIEFTVTSGWRSAADQQQLLSEAISEYGSEAEAARWVATPESSAHVLGDAVDLGPMEATAWLAKYGSEYGLCKLYENEPWHFEIVDGAQAAGCPAPLPDPSYDPRLN
ncbi:M15 family metallopeptidase [Leucobacter sp. NPDC015123]|uniref:M15 family metallopeptidase n=1 Tax=Leucobacter sp. NPDC015123 TaxID=3364129 RepID=UPI0036F49E32